MERISVRYLYGDSTESALERNYLAFLRDAVDFAVAVLGCDAALAAGRERRQARERTASEQIHAVEELGGRLTAAVEPVVERSADAPVGRCAAAIAGAVAEAVRRESAQVRAALAADLQLIEAEAATLRGRCAEALEALLVQHDLPDAEETLSVRWTGSAYEARLRQRARFGVDAILELELAGSSLFAHDLRVDRVADGVELHAPEPAGWLRKEIKMVPHRLGRHHVTEAIVDRDGVTVRLRENGQGFDLIVGAGGDVRVDRAGAEEGAGFDTDDRDAAGLRQLAARIEDALRGLRDRRRALVSATIDGVSLADHDHPRVLVDRLVETMAPVVRAIAQRSLAPGELVLKRLLADDRREEIFVSRAELTRKLDPLPPALRQALAPLGIVDDAPPRPGRRTAPHPPPPPPPPPSPGPSSTVEVDAALRELDDEHDEGETTVRNPRG